MQKLSKKDALITEMIESNVGWRYTEVVKWLWEYSNPMVPYNYKVHRGYYATNLTSGGGMFNTSKGYLLQGGNGRLFKGEDGKWYAEWFMRSVISKK